MTRLLFVIAVVLLSSFRSAVLFAGETNLRAEHRPLDSTSKRIAAIRAAMSVIGQQFREFATSNHIPGMVYGIVADGQLVYTGVMGYSQLSPETPASGSTAFRIASMTKSFVSVAILQLRDAGKLRLDDPASMYVPEMKEWQYASKDAPVITIRHLLTHSAGFPEDNPWGDRQLDVSDDSLRALLRRGISFSNSPGTHYEYSNLGFTLLGHIIRQVSGQSYEEYITTHILRPLGMTHTYWEYNQVPAKELALGYRWLNNGWVKQPMLHDGAWGAMGGMITTLEDFARYTAFQLSAWPVRDDKENSILKRSSLREMQQPWVFNNLNPGSVNGCPVISSYGYGLRWTRDCKGRTMVMHSGGLPGFGSNWTILPDYGIGIICFGNVTYAPAAAINTRALDALIRLAKLSPRPVPLSPILQQRKKELLALLPDWKTGTDNPAFAANFFLDNFPDSLRKEAGRLFRQAGKITGTGELEAENNLRGSFTLQGEQADIRVWFSLSPENPARIQDYEIRLISKEKKE